MGTEHRVIFLRAGWSSGGYRYNIQWEIYLPILQQSTPFHLILLMKRVEFHLLGFQNDLQVEKCCHACLLAHSSPSPSPPGARKNSLWDWKVLSPPLPCLVMERSTSWGLTGRADPHLKLTGLWQFSEINHLHWRISHAVPKQIS